MSWLFGYKSQVPQIPEAAQAANGNVLPNAGQTQTGTLSSAERKAMEAYRFDSSALERAAEAAKTLESSSKLY